MVPYSSKVKPVVIKPIRDFQTIIVIRATLSFITMVALAFVIAASLAFD